MTHTERENKSYDQNSILERKKGMKPSERKNEAYDQNSILERAKE